MFGVVRTFVGARTFEMDTEFDTQRFLGDANKKRLGLSGHCSKTKDSNRILTLQETKYTTRFLEGANRYCLELSGCC